MKLLFRRNTALVRLLSTLAILAACPVAYAAADVVDRVEIAQAADHSVIQVHFNMPLRYTSHTPTGSGDLLHIYFQQVPASAGNWNDLPRNEVIRWSADERVPLFEVIYMREEFPGSSLTLRFREQVDYEVLPGADFRSLQIKVALANAIPVNQSAPDARSEEAGRPGTDENTIYQYAINMAASREPFSAGALTRYAKGELTGLDAFLAYRVYTTRFVKDGKTWYWLRLGFFKTRAAADSVMRELLAQYPGAWVDKVSPEEIQRSTRLPSATRDTRATGRDEDAVTGSEAGAATGAEPAVEMKPSAETAPITDSTAVGRDIDTVVTPAAAADSSAAVAAPVTDTESAEVTGQTPDSTALGHDISVVTATAPLIESTPSQPMVEPSLKTDQSAETPDPLAELMTDANRSMTDGDYSRAIRLYTKVLQSPDGEHSQDALEFLGLARDRKGQQAHAKAVYTEYLEKYPEGEGAARVRQRLAGLLTARKTPKDKLRASKSPDKQAAEWDVFGGFSQFYRRDENTTEIDEDNELTTVSQSSLASDLDVTARLRTSDYDVRTRFTGGYLHDFLDNGVGNETTVSSLYFDARHKRRNLSLRVGRQSRSSGGVLGRFDGLLLGIPMTEKLTLRPVAGAPVDSSRDGFNESQYFYGISLDIEGFARGWDANAFIVEQRADSMVDRRAVGGELRYFDVKRSFFTLVDYDIHFNELNIAQFLGNWTAPDKTTVNLLLDYRNSPLLRTSNALQGQGVESLDDLETSFSEGELHDIAQDRTATSKLVTLGASRPLSERLQLSGDVSLANFSGTDESAGVAATDGTGNEYFYNLQLIGSNLLKDGDIAILGLRYLDANTADTISFSLNTRYPVNSNLRVNPRFRVDYRKNHNDDSEQFIYRPSVRLNYRVKRRMRLETELGGEWSDRELVDGTEKTRGYFGNIGYRLDF
jgi:hypothetical protein